jgi:formamidopyrimidine-DNA glycosylase
MIPTMPELPDLLYIEGHLRTLLLEREIRSVRVFEPVVLRVAVTGGFETALVGRRCTGIRRHGPFLVLSFPPRQVVVHFMLAGRFAVHRNETAMTDSSGLASQAPRTAAAAAKRRGRSHCFSLFFEGGHELAYLDDRRMGKVYLIPEGQTRDIPGFDDQGVDVLSEAFTPEVFRRRIQGRRQQVRVFLMDQRALSAIGNAYADEILFAARLHPKTGCHQLSGEERERLYRSIGHVLREAAAAVRAAGRPIDEKVRDHVKVRGRHGAACPVCGSTIRRTGVLGYDSFFCPSCQPAVRDGFIPWASAQGQSESQTRQDAPEPGSRERDERPPPPFERPRRSPKR